MNILEGLNRKERRAAIARLNAENAHWPLKMTLVPHSQWPSMPSRLMHVWRSRHYLAQMYVETNPNHMRLSINRTTVRDSRWDGDLSWDELMRIKGECGFGRHWAVEVYPPESDVVNVANMHHLWLLAEAPPYAWTRTTTSAVSS